MPSASWTWTSRRRCSWPWWRPPPGARPRRRFATCWRPPGPEPATAGGRDAVTAPVEARPSDAYDEAYTAPGTPRPHYASVLDALRDVDLAGLRAAVNARLRADGVTFTTAEGTQPFLVDPVPRILPPDEWAALAAGLAQRVRALNAFVVDAYGERRIVAAGLIPADVIDG